MRARINYGPKKNPPLLVEDFVRWSNHQKDNMTIDKWHGWKMYEEVRGR